MYSCLLLVRVVRQAAGGDEQGQALRGPEEWYLGLNEDTHHHRRHHHHHHHRL